MDYRGISFSAIVRFVQCYRFCEFFKIRPIGQEFFWRFAQSAFLKPKASLVICASFAILFFALSDSS